MSENFIESENCNKCGARIHYHRPTESANFAIAECKKGTEENPHRRQVFILDLEGSNEES